MAKRILIVDDSPTEMALIEQALKKEGYTLAKADSGEKCLEVIAADKPNLIVLDVVLPGLNGFEVCRKIKKGAGTADIKVVLLSTKNQESDRFWGMKQGADEYLTKPFDDEQLCETIRRLI